MCKKEIIDIRKKVAEKLLISENDLPENVIKEIYSILQGSCSNLLKVISAIFTTFVIYSCFGLFLPKKRRVRDINKVVKEIDRLEKAVCLFDKHCCSGDIVMSRHILSDRDESKEKLGLINNSIRIFKDEIKDMYEALNNELDYASLLNGKTGGYERIAKHVLSLLIEHGVTCRSSRGSVFEKTLGFVLYRVMFASRHEIHEDTIHKSACFALKERMVKLI